MAAGIGNSTLAANLKYCTSITYLATNYLSSVSGGIDLTNCTQLTNGYFQGGGRIIIPSSLTTFDAMFLDANTIDCRNMSGKTINFINLGHSGGSGENLKWQLNEFSTRNVTINSLGLDIRQGQYLNWDLLSYLNTININKMNFSGITMQENFKFVASSWTGTLKNLTHITMRGTSLGNLDFLSENTLLQSIDLNTCGISDISGLKCYSTLKNMQLYGNSISNVENIQKFVHIGEAYTKDDYNNDVYGVIDLRNNNLYDKYVYEVDDSVDFSTYDTDLYTKKNNEITYYNIKGIAKLKANNSNLTTVYLSNNGGIENYTPLTNIGYNISTRKI